MKTTLLLLGIFIFSEITFSQENFNGKSGIIYYNMKVRASEKTYKKTNAELHFNESKTLFVWNKIGMDSLQQGSSLKTNEKKEKVKEIHFTISSVDEKGYLIYRDFSSNEIILRYTDAFPFEPYIVEDKWNLWEWRIMDEYKEILGYEAQKAIAQFRGRIYIAWFTREIPVPYGPWKLFDLPGLILEAHDTFNVVVFKIKKVCYPCDESQIDKPYEKEVKSMKEHVYINDYYNEMVAKKLNKIAKKANSKSSFILGDATTVKDVKESRARNFEKIYEWERFPGDTPNPYKKSLVKQAYESVPDSVTIKFRENFPEKTPEQYWGKPTQTLETLPKSIPIEAEGN